MLLALLLLLIFIAPVRLTLLYDRQLTIHLRLWGVPFTLSPDFAHTAPGRPQQLLRALGTALRTEKTRCFLRRHVQFIRLQALLRLHLPDAAHVCLLTGALRQLCILLPQSADIRIQPEFLSPTRLQARCILFFRLGTLIITAAMVLLAWQREGREHPPTTPKEA